MRQLEEARRLRASMDGRWEFAEGVEIYKRWRTRTAAVLHGVFGERESAEFERSAPEMVRTHEMMFGVAAPLLKAISYLNALSLELESHPLVHAAQGSSVASPSQSRREVDLRSRRVFVVHGHDEATRSSVVEFLRDLGLEPVVLHEQPNAGRTLIEKFEDHSSEACFAVVLLTGDDRCELPVRGAHGKLAMKHKRRTEKRARQNVVFELGFFFSALGRSRVCALVEPGLSKPSDIDGIVYVPLDTDWRSSLARELTAAGIQIAQT